ncbi:MAG: DMT family protein [Phycisphaerales bacterium]
MQVLPTIPTGIATPALLVVANVFMTYAWYGHLRDARSASLWGVVFMSWGVAFFEYCLQVPANRIGFNEAGYSLQQLKVMQEIITMAVFAAFAAWFMLERLTLDFLWASLCLVGAAYFMFRGK